METMDQVEGRGNLLVQDESGGLRSVEKRADEIFGMLDVDHDGEITMDEFVEGYIKIHHSMSKDSPAEKATENRKSGGAMSKKFGSNITAGGASKRS